MNKSQIFKHLNKIIQSLLNVMFNVKQFIFVKTINFI